MAVTATVHEHVARTRKAITLASTLTAAGCDAQAATVLDARAWSLAAQVAGVNEPSATTRAVVVALLTDRAMHAAYVAVA